MGSNPTPAIVCEPDMVNLVYHNGANTAAGGIPVSYQWYNTNNNVLTVTSGNTMFVNQTGSYWVEAFDVYKCRAITTAVPVTISAAPIAVIMGKQKQCKGSNYTLTSAYAGNDVSYEWQKDGVFAGSDAILNETNVTTGTYEYRLIVTDLTSGCVSNSELFTVRVYDNPDAPEINFTVVKCDNYLVELNGTAATQGYFNWSNGMSGDIIYVDAGGPYKLWFTDAYTGCTSNVERFIPKDLNVYTWIVPTGCYKRCPDPEIVIPGPVVRFEKWEWLMNGSGIGGGSNTPVDPLTVNQTGVYNLYLEQPPCSITTNDLSIEIIKDCKYEECEKLYVKEDYVRDENCKFSFTYTIVNDLPYTVGFTVFSDVSGTITPGSGFVQSNNTISQDFTWIATNGLPGNGIIIFTVRFWLPDGRWCDKEFKYKYDCDGNPPGGGRQIVHVPLGRAELFEGSLKLAPNPAQNSSVVYYSLGESSKEQSSSISTIEVWDVTGRRLFVEKISNTHGQLILETSRWTGGIYQVVLRKNGAVYKTSKLVVMR